MECHIRFMISWTRERRREKKSGLRVCSQLSAGCNTDSNKIGERIRENR
jgi:hypothetical protein